MSIRKNTIGAFGAFVLAAAAIPLTVPAVSTAQDTCDFNFFWNTATNQCQFCDTATMFWNYPTNQCLPIDPTPYADPILGPAGPVGVGPNPVVGPVGPVGVGGLGPVAGPVGPVGIGRR